MPSPAETYMSCDIWSVQDELVRVLEHLRVAVRRGIVQRDGLAGSYGLSVELDLLRRRTRKASVGSIQPKELFHSCGYERLVVAEARLEGRVFGEMLANGAYEYGGCDDADD